jgi:hypothetical protein
MSEGLTGLGAWLSIAPQTATGALLRDWQAGAGERGDELGRFQIHSSDRGSPLSKARA